MRVDKSSFATFLITCFISGVFPVDDSDVFRALFAVVVPVGDWNSIFIDVVNFVVGVAEGVGASVVSQVLVVHVICWYGVVRVECC